MKHTLLIEQSALPKPIIQLMVILTNICLINKMKAVLVQLHSEPNPARRPSDEEMLYSDAQIAFRKLNLPVSKYAGSQKKDQQWTQKQNDLATYYNSQQSYQICLLPINSGTQDEYQFQNCGTQGKFFCERETIFPRQSFIG